VLFSRDGDTIPAKLLIREPLQMYEMVSADGRLQDRSEALELESNLFKTEILQT
jgi:hypothetical protein